MADQEIIKARCPTCNDERSCQRHGTVSKSWVWSDQGGRFSIDGGTEHSLLECRGCETVFYLLDSWNSENIDYFEGPNGERYSEAERDRRTYPSPSSQARPNWLEAVAKIDEQLHAILLETYTAHENQAYILTAVGLRTAFDRATQVIGIDPAIPFGSKLNELRIGGWIGATEQDILDVIVNAGSAAAHRGWSPGKEDSRKLITAVEAFLHRAFIVGQDALAVRASIPERPSLKQSGLKK